MYGKTLNIYIPFPESNGHVERSAAPATLQEGSDTSARQAREQSIAGSSKQRRDSSPAQLAFSDQIPVSSQVLLAHAFASMCLLHASQSMQSASVYTTLLYSLVLVQLFQR